MKYMISCVCYLQVFLEALQGVEDCVAARESQMLLRTCSLPALTTFLLTISKTSFCSQPLTTKFRHFLPKPIYKRKHVFVIFPSSNPPSVAFVRTLKWNSRLNVYYWNIQQIKSSKIDIKIYNMIEKTAFEYVNNLLKWKINKWHKNTSSVKREQ